MKRKYRLSLGVGLALFFLGVAAALLHFVSGYLPAAVPEAIAIAGSYIGIGNGTASIVPFGAFLALEGFIILIFRKKKRFSLFLSVPFLALIYLTALSYAHKAAGNPQPEFILSRINANRTELLLLCVLLEAFLYVILMLLAGKLDARFFRKAEKRNRMERLKKEREEAQSDDNDDSQHEEEELPSHEKEDKAYLKLKRKMEKKRLKEEAKLEKKEEKKRLIAEKKEEKLRLKAERKAEKTDDKHIAEDDEDRFTTPGMEAEKKVYIDPNAPVDVPEVGEMPQMKRIRMVKRDNASPQPKKTMPPVSDVFPEIKKELEREAVEEKKEEPKYSPKRTEGFHKGGMIEATLETMITMAEAASSDDKPVQAPIRGFEKKDETERKNDSSFAPSNLSPEHPRYRMFESLTHKKSVSSFPAKSFEADETAPSDDKPSYGSTFVKDEIEEKKHIHEVKKTYIPEIKEEKPVVETQSSEDDENYDDETGEMPQQENEFLYSVGIGGLESNELGYASISRRQKASYSTPPKSILKDYPQASSEIDDFTREQGDIIVETLADYHVSVTLDDIIKGPTVTMYELKLGEGVMVQRIKSRYDELSYSLGGVHIRILAPVPGRQAVGIEVPNKTRAVIGFKDMLYAMESNPDSAKLRVPMILGRTITGEPRTIDVAKMPHMLIAGTTGSGKSVCINSFICTLVYTRSPQQVRLIMVDPKVVELTVYNGIPHLLTPVITEDKKVVRMLKWLVDEMERRYQMLFRFGVRNIEGLNDKIKKENIPCEKLPYIVLIMDEFADLMATVGKDIENYVARLAAKARAAGIHLILATQRPSTDVITGTIKNNFPSRIAFAVSSGTNSRIILDENGAEDLLGKGDMLLMEPSTIGLQRIQGAFLSDDEVYGIVSYAQKHGTTDYLSEDIFEEPPESSEGEGVEVNVSDEDSDEVLYETAKQIVYERKNASASYLQRRMKIGYNRAARIIEMMEERGIIGPPNGSKPREILKYE